MSGLASAPHARWRAALGALARSGAASAVALGILAIAAAPAAATVETETKSDAMEIVLLTPDDEPAPARLDSPSDAAPLVAGSRAELSWSPTPSLGRLAAAEEWEAFLSLDGGATFPLRLTPHLDRDVRHFRFVVPQVASDDGRILLRFGDERRESAVLLPQRFTIVAAAVTVLVDGTTMGPARAASGVGEPALAHHAGVSAWVEGTRRGARLRATRAGDDLAFAPASASLALPLVVAALAQPLASHQVAPRALTTMPRAPPPSPAVCTSVPPPRPCPSLLLQTQRQNE